MGRLRSWILSLLAGLIWAETLQARDVRICMENWEPYFYVDPQTNLWRGPVLKIAEEAVARSGHRATFEQSSYRRCLADVSSGQFDAILGDMATAAPFINGNTPLLYWSVAALVPLSSPFTRFESLEQFSGKTVAYIGKYEYPKVIEQYRGWQRLAVEDTISAVRLASANRVDVAIEDLVNIEWLMKQNKLSGRILLPPIAAEPHFLVFHVKNRELMDNVEIHLAAMLAEGRFDTLYLQEMGLSYSDIRQKMTAINPDQ